MPGPTNGAGSGLVALDLGQAADAVPLQTPVQD
jgi:hypothetical protein